MTEKMDAASPLSPSRGAHFRLSTNATASILALALLGVGLLSSGVTVDLAATVIALVVIFFLPTIIAANRKHNNTAAILLVNLLLGWTALGWVAALIWASTDNVRKAP